MEENRQGLELCFLAEEDDQEVRVDQYLAECCEHLSRSYLQKLMKTGAVLVNEKPVKASFTGFLKFDIIHFTLSHSMLNRRMQPLL